MKAYFALKAIGDDPDAPHMARARQAILAAGGAERTNVFTRAQLALFGQVPWRAVPVMPLEIMHLPLWFPFHLSKVSYWSRTVIVPLLVLMALRPVARNPRKIAIPELFRMPPAQVRDWIRGPYRSAWWGPFFKVVDFVLRAAAAGVSTAQPAERDRQGGALRHRAAERRRWSGRHLSGDRQQRDDVRRARVSARNILMRRSHGARCASCWWWRLIAPTASRACRRSGTPGWRATRWQKPASTRSTACAWLRERQILDVVGDWAVRRPGLRPGGWAFQYANPHYPGCR